MSTFSESIGAIYAEHGSKHILPFIGSGYASPRADQMRVVAVGFNSYISKKHWPADDRELQPWLGDWWQNARHEGDTHPFYNRAFDEVARMAAGIHQRSAWQHLTPELEAATKGSLYATNALKVYTGEEYKESSAIPREFTQSFEATWRAELDAMARHECLPHLVVVLGADIWEMHWKALLPSSASSKEFAVEDYVDVSTGEAAGHAVRARLRPRNSDRAHTLLLVRLHHPSSRSPERRNAEWLLGQEKFLELVDEPLVG